MASQRLMARYAGWVIIFMIMLFVWYGYYGFVVEICIKRLVENIGFMISFVLTFNVLFVLFIWSYFKVVCTAPMKPSSIYWIPDTFSDKLSKLTGPENEDEQKELLETFVKERNLRVETRDVRGFIRVCQVCRLIKPDRCHHCSVCKQCVLKFDHHCPIVNNCVNYGNQKFFLQFLFYAQMPSLLAICVSIPEMIRFFRHLQSFGEVTSFHVLLTPFCGLLFIFMTAPLFFMHLHFVVTNQTTLETYGITSHGSQKRPYSLNWKSNFLSVFGTSPLLWFLPAFSSQGDGHHFPHRLANLDTV